MAIQWSGLGPELLLQLDRGRGQPLRSQLEAGLRDAIRSGRLQGGERLPSSRELARELGVSRGLVQECYNQLLAEGYLTSRVGSATRVAAGARPAPPAPPPGPVPPPRLIADFRSGGPDRARVPREGWTWAPGEACIGVATPDRDYGAPSGSAVLRQVVAAYPARARCARRRPRAHRGLHRVRPGAGASCSGRSASWGAARRAEDPGYGDLAVSDSARARPGGGRD
jgi:GntR family transcriptional regulator/MocR family aminotransferase